MELFNLPKNAKVLIFDIDSTLYTNSEYAHEQIDSQIRHFAYLTGITNEEARKKISEHRKNWAKNNNGKKISLGNLLTNFGITIETSIEWRKHLFNPKDYLTKDENLIRAITKLKEKYYLICVTNNPVEQGKNTLQALGINNLITEIIGLDTLKESKPSKNILELAIKISSEKTNKNITFNDCISIGDRFDIDLDLPIQLGMGGILVNTVNDVYKLPEIL